MSKIKSALELAMEKTEGIKVDKEAVHRDNMIREGRTLAGRFLQDDKTDLAAGLKGREGKDGDLLRQGALETLLSNLTLPRIESDLKGFPRLREGLAVATGDTRKVNTLMDQYDQLFRQYLEQIRQLEDHLRQQWEPRLRQKEDQLRAQTGQAVRLTPEQDPEFMKVFQDQLAQMDEQYGAVVKQGKEELRRTAG